MATYVALVRFTQQGIEELEDSPKRAAKFCKAVKAAAAWCSRSQRTLASTPVAVAS